MNKSKSIKENSVNLTDLTAQKNRKIENVENSDFPVVGIGASAGGLEALEQFFQNMPNDNGMAFIVIQHLTPLI
jgi:two-component system CheB/CheR fusion protein